MKADIKEYDPHVEGLGAHSTAWVMLQNASGSKWAQAGWRKSSYGVRRVVAQWVNSQGFWDEDTDDPKPVGSMTRYEVLYITAQNRFQFLANGVSITQPKPASFIPPHATIAGEITNLASQMPGGYNPGSEEWLYTSYYRDSAWIWRAYDSGGGADPYWQPPDAIAYFGSFQWNWWDLDIWDRACQN